MKNWLISTTSAAALLALGAGPASAASFSLSANPLDFGSTLVNCGAIAGCVAATSGETATRSGNSGADSITFGAPTAGTGYTGGGSGTFGGNGSKVSENYTFAPAITGNTGANASQTITVTSATTSHTFTITGTGVAPIELLSVANSPGAGGGLNNGDLGNVLVGLTATAVVTVKNTGNGNADTRQTKSVSNLNGTQSFSGSTVFTGPNGTKFSLNDGQSTAFTYTYAPTVRSNGATQSITATSTFTDGSKDGKNTAATDSVTVKGEAVAPVNSVSTTSALARFSSAGTSTGTASVTVTNTGDGNKAGADNGTTLLSNLHGTVGSPTPSTVFTGTGGSVNLQDSKATTFNYTFAPTARGTDTATVAATFSNGSSDGKNTSQVVNATLSGQGVGPTYQSRLGTTAANAPTGTINTPAPNSGSSAIDFGTVGALSHHTLYLDVANISADPNGGNSLLTDLSLLSFSIAGPQAGAFKVTSGVPTVRHEANDIVLPITFDPTSVGSYNAMLTFFTDAGAAFAATGNSFSYSLGGFAVAAAEPGSLLLLSAGLGGLLGVRRWRTRRSRLVAAAPTAGAAGRT